MFWAEKVVPGKPVEISSEALEGATLELLNVVLSGSQHKAQLLVSTDGEEKFMVARLGDAHPNVQLGLEFEEDVTFYAEGTRQAQRAAVRKAHVQVERLLSLATSVSLRRTWKSMVMKRRTIAISTRTLRDLSLWLWYSWNVREVSYSEGWSLGVWG